MAVLQAVLTLISQQVGRLLNTAFGWATTLLFGEVPIKRQTYLSVIALGSVLWLAAVVGIASPTVGTFLLAFVPLPDWINDSWVRVAMLLLALLLPGFVGIVSLFLVDPEERPRGVLATAKAISKGYPYTVGLALTLVLMTIIAPFVKARHMIRRWTSTHVPVVVKATDYFGVLSEMQTMLQKAHFETRQTLASWLLRWPTKVFTFFAGNSVADLVADQLTVLQSPKIEVLLHPSDLVIRGKERDVMRVHALLTEHLTFTKAYLTWSKEAHCLEDRLLDLWEDMSSESKSLASTDADARLDDLERELNTAPLSYEEWEVLFREKLLVERKVHQMSTRHDAFVRPPGAFSGLCRPSETANVLPSGDRV